VAGRIELLAEPHVRADFDSGEASLDDWLIRMALQQQRKNYVRTRVLVLDEAPTHILGYYALTPCEVDTEHMPTAKRLPRRIGGILLARLAVNRSAQGRGYGDVLLADAIATTRLSIGGIGGIGLFADAIHERAAAFYHRVGFESFRDDPLRLYRAVTWP
jgi:GNAT superfamily N-acetyltransferase